MASVAKAGPQAILESRLAQPLKNQSSHPPLQGQVRGVCVSSPSRELQAPPQPVNSSEASTNGSFSSLTSSCEAGAMVIPIFTDEKPEAQTANKPTQGSCPGFLPSSPLLAPLRPQPQKKSCSQLLRHPAQEGFITEKSQKVSQGLSIEYCLRSQ